MNITYEWTVKKGNDLESTIPFAFHGTVKNIFKKQLPELAHLAPFKSSGFTGHVYFENDLFFFHAEDNGSAIPALGLYKENDSFLLKFKAAVSLSTEYSFDELFEKVKDQDWLTHESFVYVGRLVDGKASWQLMSHFITEWLQKVCLPRILDLNEKAVRLAIGPSPSYSVSAILPGLCVLECEKEIKQGTGFFLKDVGIVTCAHVLGSNTKAFLPNDPTKKYDIEIIKSNEAIDLAILKSDIPVPQLLTLESGDVIEQMNHILVSGFPNYRLGDSGIVSPGIVTGFRMKSGIRRILTNAPIVAGNSGGPVLNKDSRVIGVAVTGSDNFNNAQDTEDHGIVPIDALELLT